MLQWSKLLPQMPEKGTAEHQWHHEQGWLHHEGETGLFTKVGFIHTNRVSMSSLQSACTTTPYLKARHTTQKR